MDSQMDLSHLRRQVRTALELSVVALAPADLIDRLASAAGLMEALIELPPSSPPVIALIPKLFEHARSALADWQSWQAAHQEHKFPRC